MAAQGITHDQGKLKELVLYIAERLADDPAFGSVKLKAVLFSSDFLAYGHFGAPITGAAYYRQVSGPVPRPFREVRDQLVEDRAAVEAPGTAFGHQLTRLVPLRPADLAVFSGPEIAVVDMTIQNFRGKTAHQVSEELQQEGVWQIAPVGSDIPYGAVFLSNRQPSPSDIARGQELARQHGWLRARV